MLKLQYSGHLMQRANLLEDPDAGKDWWQKEKRTAKDKMAREHHQLNGHEFEQILGDSERQRMQSWCDAVHEVTKSQTMA